MKLLNIFKKKEKSTTKIEVVNKKQLSQVIGGGSGDLLVPTTTSKAITKPGIG